MKQKLLPTMIGAVLASGMAAAQADITVFGHIDTAIVNHDADRGFWNTSKMPGDWLKQTFPPDPYPGFDNIAGSRANDNIDDINFVCTTCSIGFKGSEDLGNGLKAIFFLDFQYDVFSRQESSLLDRDQWLGLAGNFGQVRAGTISTSYKSHGAMIDPIYRTAAQGRANGLQSFLHTNAGEDGEGRADHTVRWDSPDWNGFKVTAHYTLDSNEQDGVDNSGPLTPPANVAGDEDDDAYGIGVQYTNGGILAFADYLTNDSDDNDNLRGDLTAWKVGGKYTMNNFAFMGQYEDIEDGIRIFNTPASGKQEFTMWHVAGSYTIGNNMVYLGYGAMDVDDFFNNQIPAPPGSTPDDDEMEQTAYTIAGVHNLSKRTSIYAAYNKIEQDNDEVINATIGGIAFVPPQVIDDPEKDIWALGMKHKF